MSFKRASVGSYSREFSGSLTYALSPDEQLYLKWYDLPCVKSGEVVKTSFEHFKNFVNNRKDNSVEESAEIWSKAAVSEFASGSDLKMTKENVSKGRVLPVATRASVSFTEGEHLSADEIQAAVWSMFAKIPSEHIEAWSTHCIKFCENGGTWSQWLAIVKKLDLEHDLPPH